MLPSGSDSDFRARTSSPVSPAPPRALSFGRAAAQYAAARPGYPPALFDTVEELAGRPLRGARTIDVGAGTGISTRLLHDRGARVTAVEPGPGMAEELHRARRAKRQSRHTKSEKDHAAPRRPPPPHRPDRTQP
ncbi:class I SAM-dependent methyltransferase [Streptomyces sp. NBC_00057]|uniref:class I SAM-dependent methyltransferase n=1 Tax=Streptomyces sp. NBC_00057 TaxID=2975634 RepID=UPI0032461201